MKQCKSAIIDDAITRVEKIRDEMTEEIKRFDNEVEHDYPTSTTGNLFTDFFSYIDPVNDPRYVAKERLRAAKYSLDDAVRELASLLET